MKIWGVCAAALVGCAAPAGETPDGTPGVQPDAPSAPDRPNDESLYEPLPPGRFEALAWDLDWSHSSAGSLPAAVPPGMEAFLPEISGGVVAADLDDDGFDDLYVPSVGGSNGLFWGGAEGFEAGSDDVLERLGEPDQLVSAADIDGDLDLDLLIAGVGTMALLRNDGDRHFTDVTDSWGLEQPRGFSGASCWGDYDQDGDLDLFYGGYVVWVSPLEGVGEVEPDRLLRNDGDGFTDVTEDLGPRGASEGATLWCGFRDLDDDGDLDLLRLTDFSEFLGGGAAWENRLSEGEGWSDRSDCLQAVGVDYGMGGMAADLDLDGDLDLAASNIGQPAVAQQIAPWEYVDRRLDWFADLPTDTLAVSWSMMPFDLDGDGSPGILVTYGPLAPVSEDVWGRDAEQPDRFLRSVDASFELQEDAFDVPQTGNSRGVAMADFDGDHAPDLVIARIDAPPSILLSSSEATWLELHLRDDGSANRHGVGARVTVWVGERRYEQELHHVRGSFSGEAPVLYFGLGRAARPDRVEVRWPDGSITDHTDDLCGDCALTLER